MNRVVNERTMLNSPRKKSGITVICKNAKMIYKVDSKEGILGANYCHLEPKEEV